MKVLLSFYTWEVDLYEWHFLNLNVSTGKSNFLPGVLETEKFNLNIPNSFNFLFCFLSFLRGNSNIGNVIFLCPSNFFNPLSLWDHSALLLGKCPIFSSALVVNRKFLKTRRLLISINDKTLLQSAEYFLKSSKPCCILYIILNTTLLLKIYIQYWYCY